MRVLPYGSRAVLAELDDPTAVPQVRARLAGVAGVLDAVAGARTVLVCFDPSATSAVLVTRVLQEAARREVEPPVTAEAVELTVRYDGADLAGVADGCAMTVDEVIALHSGATYRVRFCGFAPGFAYLDGLHERLHVPRHAEPRTRVPAGSVALGGEFTGVYPRASPGGWRLLGRTGADLWDPRRSRPALLAPGTVVRFVPA